MVQLRSSSQGVWRSRWTFITAATGATVGLGNLWKFSYLAGANGGGAFVLVYIACVLLVAVPIMIAEVVLGSRGRANPMSTMADLSIEAGGRRIWQVVGWLGCAAGLLILSYYSVIAGLGAAYIRKVANGEFRAGSAHLAGEHFNQLLTEPATMLAWQGGFLLIVALIVAAGVRRGLAMLVRISVPSLLIFLIVLVIYSAKVGDFEAAVSFLFRLDTDALTGRAVLVALGHAFFTLSIGVGTMMAYGAYVPDRQSITGMVTTVALLDTLVALLAGLAIFPLVFSLNIAPGMGPGLMFVALPYAFGNILYGEYFGALFFVVVTLTALSSGIALLEPATAWLCERYGWWRPLAAFCVVSLVGLVGVGSTLSFNLWSDLRWWNMSIFSLVDFVSANILLPLGALLIALFVGWRMRREAVRDEIFVESEAVFSLWYWLLRYIAGPAVIVIALFSILRRWFE